MHIVSRLRRLLVPLGLVGALSAIGAANASAGVLVSSAPDCSAQSSSQVFLPWLDVANYFQAPGGNFESGAAGWSLSGASVVDGNEPSSVAAAGDSHSLSLPSGSSATSPTVCVGLGEPTLRAFVKRNSGMLATLRVDVQFEDALGNVYTLPVGVLAGGSSWSLGPQTLVVANLLPLLPGDQTPVRFVFTPQGGSWQIDDVYVDPYRHG